MREEERRKEQIEWKEKWERTTKSIGKRVEWKEEEKDWKETNKNNEKTNITRTNKKIEFNVLFFSTTRSEYVALWNDFTFE